MNSLLNNRSELAAAVAQVAEVAGLLWQKGWAERNGGNITIDVTHLADADLRRLPALGPATPIGTCVPELAGSYFYCKGTNRRMRDLARDPMACGSIVRVLPGGTHYEIVGDRPVVPTSELPSHLAVMCHRQRRGEDCRATLHTHPTTLVAMSHHKPLLEPDVLTHLLWSMIPETRAFCPKGLGVVPYMLPGSEQLAQATLQVMDCDYDVVLWEKHGVMAAAANVVEAFDMVDTLEKSAIIYRDARAMGFTPEGMTQAQMHELAQAFSLPKA